MNLSKRSAVKTLINLCMLAGLFCASTSFADMSLIATDKDNPKKAVVEINSGKAHVTIVEEKKGEWSSKKLPVSKYCQENAGIVVTDIQGISLKSDTKLCPCITINNDVVLIARNKDGRIEILLDSEGNYIVPLRSIFKKKDKKLAGVQSVLAQETSDGRLSLIK